MSYYAVTNDPQYGQTAVVSLVHLTVAAEMGLPQLGHVAGTAVLRMAATSCS